MKHHFVFVTVCILMGVFYFILPPSPWVRDNGDKYLLTLGMQKGLLPGELPFSTLTEDVALGNPFTFPFSYEYQGKLFSQYLPFFSIVALPLENHLGYRAGILLSLVSGILILYLCFCHQVLGRVCFYLVLASPLVFYFFTFWETTLAVFLLLWGIRFGGKHMLFASFLFMFSLLFREDFILLIFPYILIYAFKPKNIVFLCLSGASIIFIVLNVYPQYLNHFLIQGNLSTGLSFFTERAEVLQNLLIGQSAVHQVIFILVLVCAGFQYRYSIMFKVAQVLCVANSLIFVYQLWRCENIDLYLLSNNGLFLSAPCVCALLDRKFYQDSKQVAFYVSAFGLYVLLCPYHTSYGLHFGPRILLGLCVFIILDFKYFSEWKSPLYLLLLVTGLLVQLSGMHVLFEKKNETEKLMQRIVSYGQKNILTDSPLLASDIAPLYKKGYQVYAFSDSKTFEDIVNHLKQNNKDTVLLVLKKNAVVAKGDSRFSMFQVDMEAYHL